MLIRAANWLLIFACALSLQVWAQEGNEGGAATTIRALEKKWSDAQSRNDNRSLDLIFDNALVYVEYGQLVSKGEYLARIKQATSPLDQIVPEPMTVRTFGTTAIVVGTYREISVKDGKTLLRQWRFIDTWVNKKGSWVLVAAGAASVSK
jgi:Domain of unknown function (DUF4440)